MSMFVLLCFLFTCAWCESYVISPGTWSFRGHPIAFESAELKSLPSSSDDVSAASSEADTASPVVLLNGFGVGSFHQHRLIHEIYDPEVVERPQSETSNKEQRVYCVDYLGQGKSWPRDCQDGQGPRELDLRYCGETWVDQIIGFIEEVVLPNEESRSTMPSKKVHICGNSVGAHLAVFIAAKRPDLVESLALLNATPVWGLNLPGWNGRLPAPWLPKIIGRYLFDRIRDLQTIEKYLEAAYFNKAAFDKTLMQQIRDATEGPGGHAAFASILWSPPIKVAGKKFYEALTQLDCDTLLLYGKDDPWCKPAFAKRMLEQVPNHVALRYVEVSNVGHCPNHEAPIATSQVLQNWWSFSHERRKTESLITTQEVQERWGQTTLQERKSHEIELSFVDRLAVSFV